MKGGSGFAIPGRLLDANGLRGFFERSRRESSSSEKVEGMHIKHILNEGYKETMFVNICIYLFSISEENATIALHEGW